MSPHKVYVESESEETREELGEYIYQSLTAPNSIRVLNLRPGSRHKANEIVCELLEVDVDTLLLVGEPSKTKIVYDALSWAWGRDPWEETIRIRTKGDDFSFKIPYSLVSALRALRDPKKARKIWIDAICINQELANEKNRQVPMMSKIYGKAKQVCVWLGPADHHSKIAIDFIREEVLKLQSFDTLCDDPEATPKWNAMLNLMKRPWFSRRWVVQEIALANDAIIYCGKDTIPWKDFSDAVQLFVEVETATHRLSEVTKKDPQFYHVPGWFEYVSALGASLLVHATGTLFRITKDEGRMPLLSLEYLVSTLSVFEVTEPRDSIYSLLAIAKGTTPIAVIHGETQASSTTAGDQLKAQLKAWASQSMKAKQYKVDYEQPFINICIQFISFSINQSDKTRALDIICRPWAPSPKENRRVIQTKDTTQRGSPKSDDEEPPAMPSWIPKLSAAAHELFMHPNGELKMGRKNADPLVGLPSPVPRNYSAAESRAIVMPKFGFKKRKSYYSLYASGFVLDKIAQVEVASQSGAIPEEWIAMGGWNDLDADPPEDFWRTLVADRGKNGRNPPTYYSRACKESINKGVKSGALNTTDLINDGRCSVVSEFFRRVQAVIWNRSLMRTEAGRLGIVRKDVGPGDLVCILYGCSVPVILRKKVKTNLVEEDKLDEAELEEMAIRVQRFWRTRHASQNLLAVAKALAKVFKENGHVAGMKFDVKLLAKQVAEERAKAAEKEASALVNGIGQARASREQMEDASLSPTQSPGRDRRSSLVGSQYPRMDYYEFIGECYVHGMMDGEAIKYQNEKQVRAQVFELR